jgi:hypothetical protein
MLVADAGGEVPLLQGVHYTRTVQLAARFFAPHSEVVVLAAFAETFIAGGANCVDDKGAVGKAGAEIVAVVVGDADAGTCAGWGHVGGALAFLSLLVPLETCQAGAFVEGEQHTSGVGDLGTVEFATTGE